MQIIRPKGEATLADIVTLYLTAPWNLSLSRGVALRAARKFGAWIYGAKKTDLWFAKRYDLVTWFAANYGHSGKF